MKDDEPKKLVECFKNINEAYSNGVELEGKKFRVINLDDQHIKAKNVLNI